MTSQPALTIDQFKGTRETRRDVLFVEYRELVHALVKGIDPKSEQATRLDDIMVRLSISDDTLASDMEDIKLHARISQSITEFEARKPELDKQYARLTKVITKARSEIEAADLRFTKAQHDRTLVGQPHNKNRANVTRKHDLESRNPRIFRTPEHA